MNKRVLVAGAIVGALAMALSTAAAAQEQRRFEVFGSFSYLFADVGGSGLGTDDVSGAGFSAEAAFFLNDWLGLGADVGYNRGDLGLPAILIFPAPDIDFSQWTLLFGPRFRFAETDRFRVGAQVMAGMARGSVDIDFHGLEPFIDVPGFGRQRFTLRAFEIDLDETTFAALFGVHFDLRINDRLTWRLVQPDVLVTGYGDDGQAHFRISTGLGFDF